MQIAAWSAEDRDLSTVVRLYRAMAKEQRALKPVWEVTDAWPQPLDQAVQSFFLDPNARLFLGGIDRYPLGFAATRSELLLPQAGTERIGVIRYIFTEPEARGVGIGEAMIGEALADLRERGHRRFDAEALPGHRAAKNFFESNGFVARRIVMHHEDDS